MQLRPIDPVAKRRRMMLFANNGGSGLRQALLDGAPFLAELTHSLVLSRGTGSPTFTRATTATFTDWEGVLRTVPSGCARFKGGRMVDNLIRLGAAQSSTLAVAANVSMTLAAGDYTFSMDAGTGTATFSGTGGATGTLAASASGRVEVTKTITAGTFIVTASVADLVDLQVEYVTGQADQTASEYVSVGALDYRSTQDPLYVVVPGIAGHYASTPNAAANQITGSFDLVVDASLTSLATYGTLLAKWTNISATSSYLFVKTSDTLSLFYSVAGTQYQASSASLAAAGILVNNRYRFKVSRNTTTGGVDFYYSSNQGASYTQIGSTVAGTSGTLTTSTAIVEIGSQATGTGGNLVGSVYGAQIYDTIGGTTPVVDFNPQRDATTPTGTITSSTTSEVWTLNGASSVVRNAAYHGAGVDGVEFFNTDRDGALLPSTYTYDAVSLNGVAGTYVSTPDSVAASITGDIDIRVKAALTDWTPAVENWLVGKIAGSGVRSYDMYVAATSGLLVLRASIDGTSVPQWNSTVAPTVSDGGVLWVRGCRVASTGAVTFYTSTDGDTWTQLGTVVAGTSGAIFDSTSVLTVGSNIGGATPTSGKIYQTQIYNGIDGTLAVDFDASRYAGGTTLTGSTGETWTLQGNAVIHPTNSPNTGYLAEGARTNVCLQSNAFTTTWLTTGTPSPTQNAVGPDGGATGWTMTDTSGVDASVYQGITLTAAAWTASVFIKKTTGAQAAYPVLVFYPSDTTQVQAATVDTTNGGITDWTSFTASTMASGRSVRISSYNDNYWRVELTKTGTAALHYLQLLPAGSTTTTYAGPTISTAAQGSAVFYGAQVEPGSSASTYSATTTAAVTRAADVLSYTGDNIANLKTLAVIGARYTPITNIRLLQLDDGTENNRVQMGWSTNPNFAVVTGGAVQVSVSLASTTSPINQAGSFATNDFKSSFNGVAGTPDTSGTLPTVTTLRVGSTAIGTEQPNGTIRGVYGWTRNQSQSELNAIT